MRPEPAEPLWYQPGSPRVTSLWGRWMDNGERNEDRISALHGNDECSRLRDQPVIMVDVWRHPDTGEEYVIHPRRGTRHPVKYCKGCTAKEGK